MEKLVTREELVKADGLKEIGVNVSWMRKMEKLVDREGKPLIPKLRIGGKTTFLPSAVEAAIYRIATGETVAADPNQVLNTVEKEEATT